MKDNQELGTPHACGTPASQVCVAATPRASSEADQLITTSCPGYFAGKDITYLPLG